MIWSILIGISVRRIVPVQSVWATVNMLASQPGYGELLANPN